MLDREAVLNAWAEGAPVAEIAAAEGCSKSYVYKIAAKALDAGDPRGGPRSEMVRDLYQAHQHLKGIAAKYATGIDAIAKESGLQPHIVRAAVYLATQAGEDTGLTLGQ